eukprot:GFKZ01007486.1.p1 GENE.GFKZ01007486.1~~GFKZ01007486.1.p1  ORF type:complete len:491 (+),score=36.32 GFKZ01007486.1:31-1473(+)
MGDTSWLNRRVLTIYAVEAAERFSYYGTTSQLALFLSSPPSSLAPSLSSSCVSLFTSLAYTTTLLGAQIASNSGMYRTILFLSLVYLFGALLLPLSAFPSPFSLPLSLFSLILFAFGTGGIKPNVAAFGALQVSTSSALTSSSSPSSSPSSPTSPSSDPQITAFFSAFYFVINAGAILGQLVVPAVQKAYGYPLSFFTSFLVLLLSILIFLLGNYYPGYNHESPKSQTHPTYTPLHLVRVALRSRLGLSWRRIPPEQVAHLSIAVRSLRLLLPITLFWAGYTAMLSAWLLQVDRTHLPLGLSASQWSALNPIVVLTTLPVVSAIAARLSIPAEPRIALGMFLGAVAVFFSVLIQRWVDQHTMSGLWTLPQWVLLSLAEVLASVSSLELAHRGAPEELKSTMQAAWLLVTAGGSVLAAIVFAAVAGMGEALTILGTAMLLGVALFLFAWRTDVADVQNHGLLREEMHIEGNDNQEREVENG